MTKWKENESNSSKKQTDESEDCTGRLCGLENGPKALYSSRCFGADRASASHASSSKPTARSFHQRLREEEADSDSFDCESVQGTSPIYQPTSQILIAMGV